MKLNIDVHLWHVRVFKVSDGSSVAHGFAYGMDHHEAIQTFKERLDRHRAPTDWTEFDATASYVDRDAIVLIGEVNHLRLDENSQRWLP